MNLIIEEIMKKKQYIKPEINDASMRLGIYLDVAIDISSNEDVDDSRQSKQVDFYDYDDADDSYGGGFYHKY